MRCDYEGCPGYAWPTDYADDSGSYHEECRDDMGRVESSYWFGQVKHLLTPDLPLGASFADAYDRGHYKAGVA